MLHGPGVSLPELDGVQQWVKIHREFRLGSIPLLIGTRGYYVELNCGGRFPRLDGVAFPVICPSARDDGTGMAVSPVTFQPMIPQGPGEANPHQDVARNRQGPTSLRE